MIQSDEFMDRFLTISYLFGGTAFLLMGISGFSRIAQSPGYPGTGVLVFTALLTAFGIWSLRKLHGLFKTA